MPGIGVHRRNRENTMAACSGIGVVVPPESLMKTSGIDVPFDGDGCSFPKNRTKMNAVLFVSVPEDSAVDIGTLVACFAQRDWRIIAS